MQDGTTYQYVISKTHTKVKGVGVFANRDIGSQVAYCDMCFELLSKEEAKEHGNLGTWAMVVPDRVRKAIQDKLGG